MKRKNRSVVARIAAVGVLAIGASLAVADAAAKEGQSAAQQPQMQLPPGWTEKDMQAYAAAATPGKMHEHLAKDAGTWEGTNSMWPSPDAAEPIKSTSTTRVTPVMDGRFIKVEASGEMPAGMGPYRGEGIYGFDNLKQQFVGTWIDNMSTGIMNGTGALSPDGKTLTWTYEVHCPINKKPMNMRQVDTWTGPDSKTMEMFGTDPKSGREYKMVRIEMTRKS